MRVHLYGRFMLSCLLTVWLSLTLMSYSVRCLKWQALLFNIPFPRRESECLYGMLAGD